MIYKESNINLKKIQLIFFFLRLFTEHDFPGTLLFLFFHGIELRELTHFLWVLF